MTMQEQQELMEIMREQQRVESAECLAKAELTQGSAIKPQRLTDEEAVDGMRLSHDKVTGGQPPMMEDQMSAIIDAEETVRHLWLVYLAARGSFLYCLDRAARVMGFTAYQCKLWKMYYLGEGQL